MAENKKSFSLYTDLIKLVCGSNVHNVEVEPMTDEEAGQLFKWILEYVNDLHPVVPREIRFAVGYVKKQLDEELERWKKQCEINRINGALGGRPRKPTETENNQIGFQETEQNQNKAKKPDKDKDINKDIYIKENNTTNNSSVKEKTPKSRFNPPTLDEVIAYCKERNNLVDPNKWYDFYESKGWMVGKNKMKNWKAAVRTWEQEAGFKTSKSDDGGFEELGWTDNGGFTEI